MHTIVYHYLKLYATNEKKYLYFCYANDKRLVKILSVRNYFYVLQHRMYRSLLFKIKSKIMN